MKYEIIYREYMSGTRTIRAIVEASSEDEAVDRLFDDECEDWDVKEEFFEPVDIEVTSVKEINDSASS